ncbi:MAG: glycoside hydrolase family 3 C-terminal domain-containing protein [Ruminiclostridium sp.]|nr:glycoside hydrolase family 3 C-terminal domain-containing protein [Ruminiclostridium sp.]
MTNLDEIIRKMTLEEKAGLCSGADFWHTKKVDRLGIPDVMVSDGPHGLRKQDADSINPHSDVIEAVCFPAACATACSFDRELMQSMGETLGEECRAEDVSVLLGPAVNIKRSPLCGRNFEYVSEDPYVAGELSAAYINGVQSKNVGTSIKHFAANSQEARRMAVSSDMDERTLREIYLPAFETAIKKSQPWTVMCCYNRINGVYGSENDYTLNKILRDEWGFLGYVVSDWAAVNNRVEGLKAGLDLEMPSSKGVNDAKIVEAVKNGTLDEAVVDRAVKRILSQVYRYHDGKKDGREYMFDRNADHKKAVEIAKQCMVLLKNDGSLPLPKSDAKIGFIGAFAESPRIQGGGSSHINTKNIPSAIEYVKGICDVAYAKGFNREENDTDTALQQEAIELAKTCDAVVIFAGLPDSFESEGYDRKHMRMPDCQNELIDKICDVQENVIVVLHNGSPVEMPWNNRVSAILEAYLSGEATAEATVDILFGNANPCGKLAETFPLKLSDTPCYLNYGTLYNAKCNEGVFVGYRYYDTKEMNVLYPFGHGLSYTSYEYSDLELSEKCITDKDTVTVSVTVTNTGNVAGKEIVQLYVADKTGYEFRPIKELKGFEKVELQPGESKEVIFTLDSRSFSYYCEDIKDWLAPSGRYEILIGKSSRDIVLTADIELKATKKVPFVADENTTFAEFMNCPEGQEAYQILRPIAGMAFLNSTNPDDSLLKCIAEGMAIRQMRSFGVISDEEIKAAVDSLNKCFGGYKTV